MAKHPPIPKCPYCDADAVLHTSSARFYNGRDFGPVWACVPCAAWVGVHQGTRTPLGRLANKELRTAKIRAHAAFDVLWQMKQVATQCSKGKARGAAYKWLAEQLGIDAGDCHIGMFDVEQCRRVVAICEPHAAKLLRRA